MVLFKFTERGIGLVSTIILARLLFPEDFGLVALSMAVIAIVELLGAFSFDIALIQNQKAPREHYDSAWTFNVIISCISAIVLSIVAMPLASFYETPRLEDIIYVLSIATLVQGFQNIGIVAFRKDLEFHKEFVFSVAKKIIAFVTTITLAILFKNYWALVIGIVVSRVAGVILSYYLHPYRPRLSLTAIHELMNFSKWLFINNLVIFIYTRAADFVVAKLSGSHALGLFTIAYEISNLPTTELIAPINRAVFPGYAKIASDISKLQQSFLDVIAIIMIIAMPASAGVAAVASLLVPVLLGERWLDIIPLIQIMAFYGALMAMQTNTVSIYIALGKPRVITLIYSGYCIVLIVSLIILTGLHGAIGAAWALLLSVSLITPIALWLIIKRLELRVYDYTKVIVRPIIGAFIMYFVVVYFKQASDMNIYIELLLSIIIGSITYVTLVFIMWIISGRPQGAEFTILTIVRNRFSRLLLR